MRKLVTAGLLWFAAASCGGGDGGGGPAPVDLVTLSGDSTVVLAGTTLLMAAASAGGAPATTGVTFQWSANNGNATVSQSGVVSGVARGSVTITAEAIQNGTPTGITATKTLRVRIESVVIPSAPGTLTSIDDTVTLAAQAKDALNATVGGVTMAWTSTNPAAATVNPTTGLVTAVANGTTSVIAAAQGERAADTVTVTVAQVATTLNITPDTTAFTRIGATFNLSVVASDARGHAVSGGAVSWSSTVPAVASVDGAGTITSHDDGTTYVVGTSGGLRDSVKVVVGLVYASVQVTDPSALGQQIDSTVIVRLNGTAQVLAVVKDSGNTLVPNPQVHWGLLRDTVAHIDSITGLISGNLTTGRDSVILTARTVADTIPLIVRQDVATIAVTPAGAPDLNFVGDTQRFAAQAKDGGGFDIPGRTYTWSTNNVVLGIDAAGLATSAAATSQTGLVVKVRTATGGVIDSSVSIRVKQIPNSATLSPASLPTLHTIGRQISASCVVKDSGGATIPSQPCTWSADTTGVITFSPTTAATTTITAVGNGSAGIQATPFANVFAPNFITVDQVPVSLTVYPANFGPTPDVEMVASGTAPFTVVLRDSLSHPDTRPVSIAWAITSGSVPATTLSDAEATVTAGAVPGTSTMTATYNALVGTRVVNVVSSGVSYATSIRPLLNSTCTGSACHDPVSPQQGLQLTSDSSYAKLYERAATELPSLKRVRALRPDSSYMVHKIQGTQATVGGTGVRMPEGCSGASCLSNATINLIRNWILQGALNN